MMSRVVVSPLRIFVAFEGGGAKGLVHIGALRALEQHGMAFLGLAGTSAGALVAALKATGYSANELLNPASGRTIFDHYYDLTGKRIRPIDLFGPGGWMKIQVLRRLFREDGRAVCLLMTAFALTIWIVALITADVRLLHILSALSIVSVIIAIWFLVILYERGGFPQQPAAQNGAPSPNTRQPFSLTLSRWVT
jgi:NTE family protein